MMSDDAKAPVRLTPFYETPEPGVATELLNEEGWLKQDGTEVHGTIRVLQEWAPMSLLWEFTGESLEAVKFGSAEISSKSLAARGRVWSTSGFKLTGYVEGSVEFGTALTLDTVTFHLPNYPDVTCGHVHSGTESSGATTSWSQLVLEGDGWRVLIEPYRDVFTLRQKGRERRACALTGVGEIRRVDGKSFTPEDAIGVAEALRVFLSFAFAEWCPPLLLVGTVKGTKLWERWTNYDIEPQWFPRGWLEPLHGKDLSTAFPGFIKLWQRDEWQSPLTQAVSWLIETTRLSGGTEGAIAFGQIPLEMLAWLVFVEDTPIVDAGEFDRLSAASKLQMLLSHCAIPLGVPSALTALTRVAKANNMSGPKVATSVRNTIIHPNKKNRSQLAEWEKKHNVLTGDMLWETQQLFKWYITLVLLSVIDYSGCYANRLTPHKLGEVDPVPWRK